MLSSLFVNATILVSFIFIAGQGLRVSPKTIESKKGMFVSGVFGGLLGIILMLYSIEFHGETMIDLRFIPVILLAYYCKPISTLFAAVVISAFRVSYYNMSLSSILGAACTLVIALGCIVISKIKMKDILRFYVMFLYSLVMIIIALVVLLSRNGDYILIIVDYAIIFSIISHVVYRLSEYILQSNKLFRQFKEQARKDFLTGLSNVRQYDNKLNGAFVRVTESGEKLSILAIDIDHFKKINDTYGHDCGDAVLKQLGEILQSSCRDYDIVARVGGEEFSVVLVGVTNTKAIEIAEKIRDLVENHDFILPTNKNIRISISVGVATYPESIDNLEELKKQADIELYKAKETGRNKVCSRFVKGC